MFYSLGFCFNWDVWWDVVWRLLLFWLSSSRCVQERRCQVTEHCAFFHGLLLSSASPAELRQGKGDGPVSWLAVLKNQ